MSAVMKALKEAERAHEQHQHLQTDIVAPVVNDLKPLAKPWYRRYAWWIAAPSISILALSSYLIWDAERHSPSQLTTLPYPALPPQTKIAVAAEDTADTPEVTSTQLPTEKASASTNEIAVQHTPNQQALAENLPAQNQLGTKITTQSMVIASSSSDNTQADKPLSAIEKHLQQHPEMKSALAVSTNEAAQLYAMQAVDKEAEQQLDELAHLDLSGLSPELAIRFQGALAQSHQLNQAENSSQDAEISLPAQPTKVKPQAAVASKSAVVAQASSPKAAAKPAAVAKVESSPKAAAKPAVVAKAEPSSKATTKLASQNNPGVQGQPKSEKVDEAAQPSQSHPSVLPPVQQPEFAKATTAKRLARVTPETSSKPTAELNSTEHKGPAYSQHPPKSFMHTPGVVNLKQQIKRFAGILPPLNLQTHVYSRISKKRIVTINMHSLKENDWLDGNIQILSIRPKSIVISFDHQKIKIPALYRWPG